MARCLCSSIDSSDEGSCCSILAWLAFLRTTTASATPSASASNARTISVIPASALADYNRRGAGTPTIYSHNHRLMPSASRRAGARPSSPDLAQHHQRRDVECPARAEVAAQRDAGRPADHRDRPHERVRRVVEMQEAVREEITEASRPARRDEPRRAADHDEFGEMGAVDLRAARAERSHDDGLLQPLV